MTVKQMTCTHKWQIDSHNVGTCSLCGEVRQFPWDKGQDPVALKAGIPPAKGRRPRPGNHHNVYERHRYYEANRTDIARDLLTLGRKATREKWGIPTTSSLTSLEHRWLTPDQSALVDTTPLKSAPASQALSTSPNGHLPHFPEFSGTWDPSVQLKWLEVYQNLHIKENNK